MHTLLFDCALLPQGWADDVAIRIDEAGTIAAVEVGASAGERVGGCVLPGVPNLHSHAHQCAMAGLAERSSDHADSFWTWRVAMYHYVERIAPHHLQAIAAQLYVEMLKAGYTSVAEFQYLHHDPAGRPYATVAEMSLRTLAAARNVGIGITTLPVLYRYGGFGGQAPVAGQRRFLNDADRFMDLVAQVQAAAADDPNAATGIAPHSLRAVSPDLLGAVLEGFGAGGPVHIHVAEQQREVEECLVWSGQRPVAWLLDHAAVDARWCLIHATHMTDAETEALARSGAVAGLCPTTEANLGDGLFNAGRFIDAAGRLGIGSDSHISISPVEELRWLEYGQRLRYRQRAVLAGGPQRSTGRTLFERAVAGGAQACARRIGRLEAGYRADLIVLDTNHPRLAGRRHDALLDSWVFSGNAPLVRHVYVGGKAVVQYGRHAHEDAIAARFREILDELAA